MHTLAKKIMICALVVCLTITDNVAANAADFQNEFTPKEKELYKYYSPPIIPTACEHCGGSLEETGRVYTPFGTTGLTKTCTGGTIYTGLDMMQARMVLITYVCKDCTVGTTVQGYERRWTCWDLDGCKDCGGRRFLQSSNESDWSLTGSVRDCDDGGYPYYKDVETKRTITEVYACEDCGTLETRIDHETTWFCTANDAENLIVSKLM